MQWINITEADLKVGKASALVEAFKTAALGTGQTNPVPSVVANICSRIRSEIQSSGRFRVSATVGSIPPSLKDLAVRMILWSCRSRLNVREGTLSPTDQDQQDHRSDDATSNGSRAAM